MPTPDFSKIWASNSPLPEYTFTDADYLEGWEFVGNAPPTKNEFDAWFRMVDTKLKWLYDQVNNTASKLYPVGSVYISFNATDPSTLFGGTWQRLKDTFLLANGDNYAPNTTGGSATKTITTGNLPAHNHTVNANGNHTHGLGSLRIRGSITASDPNEVFTAVDEVSQSGALRLTNLVSRGGIETFGGAGYNGISFDTNNAGSWSGSLATAGSHTHTTNNTGSGLPLNIMPPYQTVYMWKRTA